MNISSIGTVHKSRDLENEKKIWVLAIQKVAKTVTGNIGKKKKSSGRRYQLCKLPQHAEG